MMAASVPRWSRLAATVCSAVVLVSCRHVGETSRLTLRFTTGPAGGGADPLGKRLGDAYAKLLPQTNIEVHTSEGAVANVQALQAGQAEVGFTFADVAYLAFEGQLDAARTPFQKLRGIAVMRLTPLHLIVSGHSPVGGVGDLRGRHVGLGPRGSGTALTANLVLREFGLSVADVRAEFLPFTEAGQRLSAGTLDAMFESTVYPAASVLNATRSGAHLVPVVGPPVQRLLADYPFFRPTLIPPDAYLGSSNPVHTIGVALLLVCRSDLDESLVYELTRGFFDALPWLWSSQDETGLIDLDQAPATPIPLHDGAARYYRERELLR
jgi:uncharacterized protein